MSTDKLLDKVQKLLAMSTSSNAHEAAAFMEKAQKLMEDHNLTNKDIHRNQIGEIFIRSTQSVSKMNDWECSLMNIVAKAFGCSLIWSKGHSRQVDPVTRKKDYWGRFVFIGPKDKLQLAEYTGTFLLRQLVKERSAFSTQLAMMGYTRGKSMTAQLDGFCKGWVKTIRAKVYAFSNSPELQAVIDEFIKERCGDTQAKRNNRGNGSFGHWAGVDAAANVDIHRPMDQEEQLRIG